MRISASLRLLATLLVMTGSLWLLPAQNFSGRWTGSANGFPWEVHMWQSGNRITGYLRSPDARVDNTLQGTVNGNEITFKRSGLGLRVPQEYRGYLFGRGEQGMAGVFSHEGNWSNGWYMLKAGEAQPLSSNPASTGPTPLPGSDLLGSVWQETEGEWRGTWNRRGKTNVFDGVWDGPNGGHTTDVLTLTVIGNNVTISRAKFPNLRYTGTIGADRTATGTVTDGTNIATWRAVIR